MAHVAPASKLKTVVAVLGATALLLVGIGVAADAAGKAKPVLLGAKNKATKATTIQNKKSKPALALKTKSGPALSVNTNSLIANLNADLVDGKSLDDIAPVTQTFSIGTSGQPGSGASQYFQTTSMPGGTYEFFLGGAMETNTGDSNTCAVLDATRFVASGGTDLSAIYIYDTLGEGGIQAFSGHFVGNVTAGNRLMFACGLDTGSTVVQPAQFVMRKLDRTGAIPNVGPTTFPKGAKSPVGN
ncbi:MAG TPA: hypothetical protein VFV89_16390 [Nocardioides sp.]|uniref:hypothetical protein n=1 Tax=Nocardioides sp. TaxID=35761 RepID=UPI002E33B348|nr:hypothetical protein [Nocardioides sp.]HEX5089389.1 hypothetical protein [Nocardioides sp.]